MVSRELWPGQGVDARLPYHITTQGKPNHPEIPDS